MTAQPEASGARAPSVVSVASRYDFTATISRLKETLAARGVTLFAEIDQSEAATQAGQSLRPTTLFVFGNPKAGTPIMQANPHAALELPLKAVVWEDERQQVHIDYQDVTVTLPQYGIDPPLLAPLHAMPVLIKTVAGQP